MDSTQINNSNTLEALDCVSRQPNLQPTCNQLATDTISRQAAIDAIHEDADWLAAQGSDWQVERMERDKSILKSLPTVQPTQEIIHCRDCKFARMTVNGECKYCDIWFPDEKTYMPGDYYCASAERKGEAE